MNFPTGTVAFLYTDIEGSTRLWEKYPDAMRTALERHDLLMRQTIVGARGLVFRTMGDAFCAAFYTASDAVRAAIEAQIALSDEPWADPVRIRVRMAVHVGAVDWRDGDYHGPPMNRVARLLAIGYGEQVLLSDIAQELCRGALPAECSLYFLGEHRLKDLGHQERVFQLCHPALRREFPAVKSLENLPNNLPEQLTSFIGRESEVAALKRCLGETRLLTLTGAGGCGKTRLALQATSELADDYEYGVWFVELASLSDADLVSRAVAGVFELREEPGKPILETLTAHLKDRRLLILLDNCEHVLADCAHLADRLLRHCPKLAIVSTSREAFGITGEMTFRVPSLSLPRHGEQVGEDRLLEFESVQLFLDRARFYAPSFSLTRENAPALASVCRRLDGIPLAIELAAARVRSISVVEVDQRLDQRFKLLTGGSRTSMPRQQTLRSLIDWSYDLLSAKEQVLLSRVSIFTGGWTLRAAEDVCVGGGIDTDDILDLLTSLVDKSLVMVDEAGETARYRMLETIRDYARERLREREEEPKYLNGHLDFFLKIAEEADPKLHGPDQQRWFDRLETERDNIRTALAWASEGEGDAVCGLRLAGSIMRFWYLRGDFAEGRQWLQSLLSIDVDRQPDLVRGKALMSAGALAHQQSDDVVSYKFQEEALSFMRRAGSKIGTSRSLNCLANLAVARGDYATAWELFHESLTLCQEVGDEWQTALLFNNMGILASCEGDSVKGKSYYEQGLILKRRVGDAWGISDLLHNLGEAYMEEKDFERAQALYEESLAIRLELKTPQGISNLQYSLGCAAAAKGDLALARKYFCESLSIKRMLGDRMAIASTLAGRAGVAGAQADYELAALLWGAAERLRQDLDVPLSPTERKQVEAQVEAAHVNCSNQALFEAKWQEGRKLTLEEAISAAL